MAYHPFRHLGLKFLAIALATLLWLTVAGDQAVERGMRVPLEFRNKPPDLEVVGDPPTMVDVRLSGSSTRLSRMDPGEIVAVLDLTSARTGVRLFNLNTAAVRLPYGVEVSQIVPSTIWLELEKSAKRTVNIVPALEGEPAPGFVVGRVLPDPPTVQIVGPESRVSQVGGATTEPISVEGRSESVRDTVNVGVADSGLRLVEAKEVTVDVEIVPAPVERAIDSVPIRWRNLAPRRTAILRPTLIRVTVRGRREAIENLRGDDIEVFVDLDGLGTGRYNLQVRVEPAQAFGVIATEPPVVDVTIR
jgi:YbbR domain-containing protein